jgi:hypothetical protein
MKKINPVSIVILSTLISVIIMVSYNRYLYNSINYVEGKSLVQGAVHHSKEYIPNTDRSNDNDSKALIKGDGEVSNTKGFTSNDLLQEELSNEFKNEDENGSNNSNTRLSDENAEKINRWKDRHNEMQSRERIDSLEEYYDNKGSEQSVFKVSTGKIMESLTISDKIRLLYVSMKLGKENYKKVEAYLYADNAEDGVLKALKLLKEDLSEKEYSKVRKIAVKFIDMDVAESLY